VCVCISSCVCMYACESVRVNIFVCVTEGQGRDLVIYEVVDHVRYVNMK
jgi:hypothetical protein